MIRKSTLYIYSIFFIFNISIFSQDYSLSILSTKRKENDFLKKIDFKKVHKDSISVFYEINKIHDYIKNEGYFTSSLDSTLKKEKKIIAFFSLGEKINDAIIKINPKDSVKIPIHKLQERLNKISLEFDKQGKSFSKTKLSNIKIIDKTLFADLITTESRVRTLDKIILKGYTNFPKSFLKNYYKLKENEILSKNRINTISKDTENLFFVEEIKLPEILFTKDSTYLYLYLNKLKNNSIDALINFASQENGDLLFNGNVDLKLNNVLDIGENFELFWNSIGNERQEFKFSTTIPYLFNSPISPKIEFSIYRQDSTFTNTKFSSSFNYDINSKLKLALYYSSENSQNTIITNTDIVSYKNIFFGFNINYAVLSKDVFRNNKLKIEIKPTFGERKTDNTNSKQFKINLESSYLWELNYRTSLFIKNNTGILNSDQYFTNELFRIGGVNSLRGFNEQSIFTRNYSYLNIEYRYLTSKSSYLYTISDLGFTNSTNNNSLFGLGLGYLFLSKNSKIDINFAIGKANNSPFNFNDTKLGITWINYF